MNIFIIPSWYPSNEHPHAGVFTLEQVLAMAKLNPADRFGISLWGQKDENKLLWVKDHVTNIKKLLSKNKPPAHERELADNVQELYTPAFTWTEKILSGNINGIIEANEQNFFRFLEKAGSVSLIHAHVSFPAGFVALHLAKKYKVPYIITEHMSPFPFDSFISNGEVLNKVLNPLKQANAVVAVSPAAALEILQKTGVNTVVIPNLVNEKVFHPQSVESTGSRDFTFFTLGNMAPQKGIPDLLRAIALMGNKKINFRIGGDGDHLQEYQDMAKQLQLDTKIQWLGELTRKEAAEEFRNCHAFVLPSIHESMGVVYAEALACGKPIIATRCGGPEYIVQEHNGLLTDVNAPDQLASAMDHMIRYYSKYSPTAIREDFMKRFSSTAVTEQIYTLYNNIISRN